jgi:hypothetical protein
MINERLLGILACPVCRGAVTQEDEEIVCQTCGRRYPVKRGIPVMLEEESKPRDRSGPQQA